MSFDNFMFFKVCSVFPVKSHQEFEAIVEEQILGIVNTPKDPFES